MPIFVFGSNTEGRHGAGAALYAVQQHGAIYGTSSGPQGQSYAIITKELRPKMPPIGLRDIQDGVDTFLSYARKHSTVHFNVTRIGCGLAGFTPAQIAPMFHDAPPNVFLPW